MIRFRHFRGAGALYLIIAVSVIALPGCEERISEFRHSIAPGVEGNTVTIESGPWSLRIPGRWRIVHSGKTGERPYIRLAPEKRDRVGCLITVERRDSRLSLERHIMKRMTRITANLVRSGFIIHESAENHAMYVSGENTGNGLRGFSYEFSKRGGRKKIAIACFAADTHSVLAVMFETPLSRWNGERNDMRNIIGSLRHREWP